MDGSVITFPSRMGSCLACDSCGSPHHIIEVDRDGAGTVWVTAFICAQCGKRLDFEQEEGDAA